MARPAGSKNKTKDQIDEMIAQVKELDVNEEEKQEAISELEDLLGSIPSEGRKLIGYHPITGSEIWE